MDELLKKYGTFIYTLLIAKARDIDKKEVLLIRKK